MDFTQLLFLIKIQNSVNIKDQFSDFIKLKNCVGKLNKARTLKKNKLRKHSG